MVVKCPIIEGSGWPEPTDVLQTWKFTSDNSLGLSLAGAPRHTGKKDVTLCAKYWSQNSLLGVQVCIMHVGMGEH